MTCICGNRHPESNRRMESLTYGKQIADEVRTASLWRDVVIETIATMFLMVAQCILPLSWGLPVHHGSLVQTALGMGCVVIVMIEAFGSFSGSHMNPAVTLAMVVAGKISCIKAVLYVAAQCLGAISGAGFVFWLTPDKYRETLAATTIHPELNIWKGVILEIWITGCLVFTIFGSANAKRRPVFLPSLPIGMAVMLGVLTGAPYTGGSMNPARSLGPAVVMNIWHNHWVYWAGPCVGATLATLIYHYGLDYQQNDGDSDDGNNDDDYHEDNNNGYKREENGLKERVILMKNMKHLEQE